MQSFWNKFKAGYLRFMQGRYGADQLGLAVIWTSLILNLAAAMCGNSAAASLLNLLSTAGWIWALWRLLSRNKQKRYAENQWFLARWATIKTPVMQAVARFKNRKKYVYFTCPQCHMKLRLPRGVGKVTVKCSKCGHSFEKKA
ncbi:MAG: hypothetical protein J5602_13105 [Clostridia bacterium]|nr:hypothetical protein [Clostridia bacterium]